MSGRPASCPYCGGPIQAHAGRWWCERCDREGSYRAPGYARANLRLGNCSAYLSDLEKFAAGDVNRFGRMVDGRGAGLGSAERWRGFVLAILSDPVVIHGADPDRLSRCVERARRLGIDLQTKECAL